MKRVTDMTVGIPGVGFGGIFYLIGALVMPIREAVKTVRGESNVERWAVVATQWSLAAGILVALWGTGWVLGHVLPAAVIATRAAGDGRLAFVPHNVLPVSALAGSVGMLATLIVGVRVAHLVLRRRGGIPAQQLTPMPVVGGSDALRRRDAEVYLETGT
jgi:hypothetical protein